MKSVEGLWSSLACFVCWLILGQISYIPETTLASIALIWLPTGAALAVVSVVAPWRIPWLVGASVAAAFVYSLGSGMPVTTALVEGLGEGLAVTAGAALLRASRQWVDARLRWVGQISACGLAATISSSGFIVAWQLGDQDLPWGTSWVLVAVGVWVGALLVTPLVTSFSAFRPKRSGGMTMLNFGGGALAYAGFLLVASLVFQGDVTERFGESLGPPLTYLPLSLLVLTALVWGERGGLLAIASGAALMIGWTAMGRGPFASTESFPGEALLEVQAYVAVIALLSGLLFSLQERTARALEEAKRWRLRYLQVLDSGGFTTLAIDPRNGRCEWSENAASFFGRAPELSVSELIERAGDAEQPLMRAQWQALQQGSLSQADWDWPDGSHASLTAITGPDGKVEIVTALLRKARQRYHG